MNFAINARAGAGDRYLELVRDFPLRPLKNKGDYGRATEVLDGFVTRREGSLSKDERDYVEPLSLLVEAYDNRHTARSPDADPLEVLKHLMEEHEMNTTDLGVLMGSKGVASEVLNGKRSLSKAHMTTLAEKFHVDVSVFFPLRRVR